MFRQVPRRKNRLSAGGKATSTFELWLPATNAHHYYVKVLPAGNFNYTHRTDYNSDMLTIHSNNNIFPSRA